jgi:hypothetical protein
LFASRSDTNPGTSIVQYLSSLCWRFAPHPNVGREWVPDPSGAAFKPSLGLVAIITNDNLDGGSSFGDGTMTANTLAGRRRLEFAYASAGNQRVMRRQVPDSISADVDDIINTVAHEFGHTFNLSDEYEEFPGNDPRAAENPNVDASGDNVARMAAVFFDGTVQPDGTLVFNTNEIDPDKVKWFRLPRIQTSDVLIAPSQTVGAQIKVRIDKRFIGAWVEAEKKHPRVCLRARDISNSGRQLPLKVDAAHFLDGLEIKGIDVAQGAIVLAPPAAPPPAPFPKGSLLFVPRRDAAGDLVYVVERKVIEKIQATHKILNRDADITRVNDEEDTPIDIADFKPPCKTYKLIGVYEGARRYAGRMFRPAGLCKMRKQSDSGTGDGEFCHVCKYLIVNRVDPSVHGLLDRNYYPTAKKNG